MKYRFGTHLAALALLLLTSATTACAQVGNEEHADDLGFASCETMHHAAITSAALGSPNLQQLGEAAGNFCAFAVQRHFELVLARYGLQQNGTNDPARQRLARVCALLQNVAGLRAKHDPAGLWLFDATLAHDRRLLCIYAQQLWPEKRAL